jgi:hypothetical protein
MEHHRLLLKFRVSFSKSRRTVYYSGRSLKAIGGRGVRGNSRAVVGIAGVPAEVTAWIEPIAGGWRYLFSPTFRAQTHEAWRHEHIGYVVWDVFWGMLGLGLSLAVVYLLAALAWQVATS